MSVTFINLFTAQQALTPTTLKATEVATLNTCHPFAVPVNFTLFGILGLTTTVATQPW